MASPNQQPSTGGTVTVACKYPSGVVLRGFRKTPKREQTPSGSREFDQFDPTGDVVAIAGPQGVPFGQVKLGQIVTPEGFAITTGVSKELWDLWFEQNRDSDLVKNHLIFARADSASVEAWAREHAKAPTGIEPIDPDNPAARTGMRVEKDKEAMKSAKAAA